MGEALMRGPRGTGEGDRSGHARARGAAARGRDGGRPPLAGAVHRLGREAGGVIDVTYDLVLGGSLGAMERVESAASFGGSSIATDTSSGAR